MKHGKRLLCALVVTLFVFNQAHAEFWEDWLYLHNRWGLQFSYDYNYISPKKNVYPLTFGLNYCLPLYDWFGISLGANVGYTNTKTNITFSDFDMKVPGYVFSMTSPTTNVLQTKSSNLNFAIVAGLHTGMFSVQLGFGGCKIRDAIVTSDFTSATLLDENVFLSCVTLEQSNISWTFMFQPVVTLSIPIPCVWPQFRVGYNYIPEYKELSGLFIGAGIPL